MKSTTVARRRAVPSGRGTLMLDFPTGRLDRGHHGPYRSVTIYTVHRYGVRYGQRLAVLAFGGNPERDCWQDAGNRALKNRSPTAADSPMRFQTSFARVYAPMDS